MASIGGVLAAGAFFILLLSPVAEGAGGPSTVGTAGEAATPTTTPSITKKKRLKAEQALNKGEEKGKEESQFPLPKRVANKLVCQPKAGQGPEMVMIAPGTFRQGSPEEERGRIEHESPQHSVTIEEPFAIGRCEVTVAQFRQFVEATNYQTDAEKGEGCWLWDVETQKSKVDPSRNWRDPGFEQTDSHPATCVSWQDAQIYVQWLNTWLGLEGERIYRLPTESEWEFATRAGTLTPFYWGGESQCVFANGLDNSVQETGEFSADWTYADCSDGYVFTAPVGSYEANRWGLYDTSGNVWEWVQDCYVNAYDDAPTDGSAHEAKKGAACENRSLRGGGWYNYPLLLRSANRNRDPPDGAYSLTGFRLARTP